MRKYLASLLALTLLLAVASLCPMWLPCCAGRFLAVLPFLPLYFALVTGLQHYAIVKSMKKSPRTFIKNFMGLTVGVLILHLAVLSIWALTHLQQARTFLIAFCIGYVAYLIFETVSLLLLIRRMKKNQD